MCEKLCVDKLCVDKLCVDKSCVRKMCVSKLCVSKLCVDKLCVGELCVCVHCYSHAENYNWTFDDYARYVFRIHAPKTMHVMFSEFMRQRLLNSRGLQGMS